MLKLRKSGIHLHYSRQSLISDMELGNSYMSGFGSTTLTSPAGGDFGRGLVEEGLKIMTSEELLLAVNDWSIDRRLGAGGQANVYKARVAWSRRPLAVKRLSSIQGGGVVQQEEAQATFIQEAEKLYGLGTHPNIIHIYAICPEELALVMELGSMSLHDGLSRNPLLPWRKRLNFLHDAATALAHVHSSEMLHLDIKPANIIISKDGNDALLADFGMAGKIEPGNSLSARSGPVGTVIYKDTYGDGVLRPASDIYSLGVTILEVVCGE
jgi:serine/threonine protein kinase